MKKYLIFLGILIFILPTVSLALDAGLSPATKGIVPCNGTDCNFCHVVELGQNILTWLIAIFAAIIALVFVIGGLKMVIYSTNESEITKAKGMMTDAIIGFIILLASWLIVDTILKVFIMEDPTAEGPAIISQEYGPWNQIKCVAQPSGATPATSGTTPTPGTGTALNVEQINELYGAQIADHCQGSPIPNCTEVVAALIAAESSGRPDAVSSENSLGLMQLLASNGGATCSPSDSACIDNQIETGIDFLNNQYTSASQSITKALASYNGGSAAIKQSGCCAIGVLAYQCPYDCNGQTNYNQCTSLSSVCTPNTGFQETRDYVVKICTTIGGCPN